MQCSHLKYCSCGARGEHVFDAKSSNTQSWVLTDYTYIYIYIYVHTQRDIGSLTSKFCWNCICVRICKCKKEICIYIYTHRQTYIYTHTYTHAPGRDDSLFEQWIQGSGKSSITSCRVLQHIRCKHGEVPCLQPLTQFSLVREAQAFQQAAQACSAPACLW